MIKIKGCILLLFFFASTALKALPPAVSFFSNAVCESSQMSLNAAFDFTNDSIVAYDWDLDNDGQFDDASGALVFKTFVGHGDFAVGLRLRTINNESASAYQVVQVWPIPNANFTLHDLCDQSLVNAVDSSDANTASVVKYLWTFGVTALSDSVSTAVSHRFALPGIYNVSLKLITSDGCVAVVKRDVNVFPNPVSDFSSASNCLGDSSVFTERVTIASGFVAKYNWDFNGDKIYADGTGVQSKYGYFSTGHELVGLRCVSDKGCVHDTIKTISVYPRPNASFLSNPSCEKQKVVFSNLTYNAVGTVTYYWSFDNGDTLTPIEPNYAFSNAGDYNVKLIAVNSFGCKDSVVRKHSVLEQPHADFTFSEVCFGNKTTFADVSHSANTLRSRIWDFNDGNGEVGTNPQHLYTAPGNYEVYLRVESETGCADTVKKVVPVYALPVAEITAPSLELCQDDSLRLDGSALIGKTFIWSTASTESFIYVKESAKYELIIFDVHNCSAKASAEVVVHANPVFAHSADATVSLGTTIQLWASGNFDFVWSNPQGDNLGLGSAVDIRPENSGNYSVTASNAFSCTTTLPLQVTVVKDYNLIPNNLITPNNDGKNDNWTIANITAYSDCGVIVFNRWGQAVFHSAKGYNNDWNGKDDSGNELPDGGYFYVIKCDGMKRDLTGPITILRTKE